MKVPMCLALVEPRQRCDPTDPETLPHDCLREEESGSQLRDVIGEAAKGLSV